MVTETKDNKFANMKLIIATLQIDWPSNIGIGKSVEVKLPIAQNDKVIKQRTGLLSIPTGGKKRKADMSVCLGDI